MKKLNWKNKLGYSIIIILSILFWVGLVHEVGWGVLIVIPFSVIVTGMLTGIAWLINSK